MTISLFQANTVNIAISAIFANKARESILSIVSVAWFNFIDVGYLNTNTNNILLFILYLLILHILLLIKRLLLLDRVYLYYAIILSLHQWHKMVLKHIICYNYFWDKISSNKSSYHERPTGIAYFLFCPQSHLQHYLLNFFYHI